MSAGGCRVSTVPDQHPYFIHTRLLTRLAPRDGAQRTMKNAAAVNKYSKLGSVRLLRKNAENKMICRDQNNQNFTHKTMMKHPKTIKMFNEEEFRPRKRSDGFISRQHLSSLGVLGHLKSFPVYLGSKPQNAAVRLFIRNL